MGHSKTQSSVKMKSLLVLAAVSAVALADEEAKPAVLPFGYGYAGLGYAGLGYHGLGYAGLGYPAAVGPAITYTPPPHQLRPQGGRDPCQDHRVRRRRNRLQ